MFTTVGDEQPCLEAAHLAAVAHRERAEAFNGVVKVSIVQDHCRGLATELQGYASQIVSAQGCDASARHRGAREGHLVHKGVGDQVLADVPICGDDIEHPCRKPGLREDLGQHVGVEGRLGRGLEDHRASGEKRRCQLLHGGCQRHVPRNNGGDDPDRFADDQGVVRGRTTQGLERVAPSGLQCRIEDSSGGSDLDGARLGDRAAHLFRHHLGVLVVVVAQGVRQPLKDRDALLEGHARPGSVIEGRPGRVDCTIDVRL